MRFSRTRTYMLLRNTLKELLPMRFPEDGPVGVDGRLEEADPVVMSWPQGVPKPRVGLVRDIDQHPYWTKYHRFLQANDIPFELYDIHRSSWLRDAERFDMVVWRPASYPYELEECRRKFNILEHELGTLCYPSFAEALIYEDKIVQYDLLRRHDLPVIDTFISHSEADTMAYLAACEYPLVWKVTTGSGSLGVELVRERQAAERRARRVFDSSGRRTYWPYVGQKNYVYLQKLVPQACYDLRVIAIGPMVFGYYRDVPQGEFRASGMDLLRWDVPPPEAMRLARRVAEALDLACIAVDLLADASGRLQIIEISQYIGVESPGQLRRDGVPGAFVFDDAGDEPSFVPMRVWIQELALKRVLETRWMERGKRHGGEQEP